MNCERYYELLSARLDRELAREEAEELELHLADCPQCRILGEQMEETREAFAGLAEVSAPEGFAQGVMDRIRAAETEKKVIPLFKRPQFKALAGLAACLALVVGLYGAVQPQKGTDQPTARYFTQDALEEDAPMITAYAGGGTSVDEAGDLTSDMRKAVPGAGVYGSTVNQAGPAVLMLDRMPEGGWELIPPETPVSPEGVHVTRELFEEIGRLAQEENITASMTSGWTDAEEFVIVVLKETE